MTKRFAGLPLLLATVIPAGAVEFSFGKQTLTVPDGYTVELAATSPLTDRPIMGDFDDHGRFYIAEASGTNADVQTQLKQRPHKILRLEDSDGDGVFDKRTVFADGMMFPEGVLCYRGDVYVSAPPSIWKLTDTDADGVADERFEWFKGKTLTGCANDLHGPYLGHDGWIYWCKGAFAEQSYERRGSPFVTRAAHVFRQRPEGSEIEPVMTGGMDNPVEVAFSPAGERFFTSTFVQHPGGGRRDGIIHAIYGGVYGKEHNVLDGHIRTGPSLMPIMTHLGPAAACALEWIDSDALGMQGNLFASLFNMRKITRHQLVPTGATFRTEDSDFLVSDSIDFHPTDIVEDADGSLLVIDTGGWYKLCCPTSQLHKPDVLGAIYRVRKVGSLDVEDPRGTKIDWAQSPEKLVPLLGDARHVVRDRAMDKLAVMHAIPVLKSVLEDASTSAKQRLGAVWALCRIDEPAAREAGREALDDASDKVRIAALHAVAVWRDEGGVFEVAANLSHSNAAVRRAAAEASGRLGSNAALHGIFEAVPGALADSDPVLLHSLTYALIEIGSWDVIAERYLLSSSPDNKINPVALAALSQLGQGTIVRSVWLGSLFSDDEALRKTAWWAATSPGAWSDAIGEAVEAALMSGNDSANRKIVRKHLPRLVHLPKIQGVLRGLIGAKTESSSPEDLTLQIAEAIDRANLSSMPQDWLAPLGKLLDSDDAELRLAAARTLTSAPLPPGDASNTVRQQLLHFSRIASESAGLSLRLKILAAAITKGGDLDDSNVAMVVDALRSSDSSDRTSALNVLEFAALTNNQRQSLAMALADISPLQLSRVLPLLTPIASDVLPALAELPSLATIPEATLQVFLKDVPQSQRTAFLEQTNLLEPSSARGKQLEDALAALPEGDIVRGQTVFNSQKAMCFLCHEIGYLGGNLGPDLTRIGTVRSRRDLLEAIMFPGASFVRSYESVLVTRNDGSQVLGISRGEDARAITLATAPETEVTIARNDIKEMAPSTASLMPVGLYAVLTQQELADLLTFLENTKWR